MKLERRIRALENKLASDPFILVFADGTRREIPSVGNYWFKLFIADQDDGDLTPNQKRHIEWIRESVGAFEPGGGHLIDLFRSILNSPTEDQPTERTIWET